MLPTYQRYSPLLHASSNVLVSRVLLIGCCRDAIILKHSSLGVSPWLQLRSQFHGATIAFTLSIENLSIY